jgi:hypothetical protein
MGYTTKAGADWDAFRTSPAHPPPKPDPGLNGAPRNGWGGHPPSCTIGWAQQSLLWRQKLLNPGRFSLNCTQRLRFPKLPPSQFLLLFSFSTLGVENGVGFRDAPTAIETRRVPELRESDSGGYRRCPGCGFILQSKLRRIVFF